jgi:hypothetical protein
MKSGTDAAFVVCLFAANLPVVGSQQMPTGPSLPCAINHFTPDVKVCGLTEPAL